MFTPPMKPVGGTAPLAGESATSSLRKAQEESASFSSESHPTAGSMLLHETRTVRTTNMYETSSSPTPVRPPRRLKNVTVQQANQMLDEVKQEQEKNVVIDTLAALVTDVNATAQVLRRSVSRSRLEESETDTSILERTGSESIIERPASAVWERPSAEVEYHLHIHSPAHMDYSDARYSPYATRKPIWEQDQLKSGKDYSSRECLSRARSETPTRKIILLEAVAHSSAFLYVPEPFSNCGLAHIEEGYEEPAMTGLPKALPWSVTISCKCRSEELHPIIVQCHGNLIETEPGTGRSDVILTTASCLQRHTSCRQCKVIQQAPKRAIPISIVLPNLEYQTNHLSNNVALLFTATYIKFNNASSPVCLNDDKDEGKAKERCVVTSTGNGLGAYPAYIKAVANYSEHRCNTSTTAACTEISLQPPSDYIREGLTMLCQRNNRWVLHAIGDGQWSNNRTMLANVADSKHWINTKIKYIRSNLPEIRTPRKLATRIRTSSHRNSTRVQVKDNCC